ncbi:MAG: hypothetical protein Q4C04_04370 [Clostridia bacterium]|nr:hypothetical protein [Clostridia bacterium]
MITVADVKRCRVLSKEIEAMREQVQRLRWIGSGLARSGPRENIGTSPTQQHDHIAEVVALIDAAERKHLAQIEELVALQERISDWIGTLPPDQALIIRLRYMQGLSWRAVARRASYSERQCFRLNDAALKKL